jgi:hypothetical protein
MALGIVPIGNPPFAGSMEAAGIEPAKGFRRSLLSGHRDLEVQVRRNLVRVVVAAELDLDPANRAAQSVGGPSRVVGGHRGTGVIRRETSSSRGWTRCPLSRPPRAGIDGGRTRRPHRSTIAV